MWESLILLWPASIHYVGQDRRCHKLVLLNVVIIHLGQTKQAIAAFIRHLLLLLRLFVLVVHRFATWRLLWKSPFGLDDAKIGLIIGLSRKLFNLVVVLRKASRSYRDWGSHKDSCSIWAQISTLCLYHNIWWRIAVFWVSPESTSYCSTFRWTISEGKFLVIVKALISNDLRQTHCLIYLLVL